MNAHSRLAAAFLKDHPETTARVLEDFPAESVAQFLGTANATLARQVIEHFIPGFAASCLATLEPAAAGRILSQLQPDFQILLIRQLHRDQREPLLNALDPDTALSLRRRLPYPTNSAGAIMEAPLASVPEGLTIRDALKRIKRIRRGMKFYVYVVNEKRQLTGVLTLHQLVSASPSRTVGELMHRHVVNLSATQAMRTVIDSPYWQEYYALPVTDEDNVLLGVIRQKSLRRFEEQSVHADALSAGLATVVAVGELFSSVAGQLLDSLISSGASRSKRGPHA